MWRKKSISINHLKYVTNTFSNLRITNPFLQLKVALLKFLLLLLQEILAHLPIIIQNSTLTQQQSHQSLNIHQLTLPNRFLNFLNRILKLRLNIWLWSLIAQNSIEKNYSCCKDHSWVTWVKTKYTKIDQTLCIIFFLHKVLSRLSLVDIAKHFQWDYVEVLDDFGFCVWKVHTV